MVNRDFSDLFAALNDAGVQYLVIGAHAIAFHAEPRFTKDLDIATQIDGVQFAESWPQRVESTYGDHQIWVIGRAELMANKRATARPQDLIDIALLERHRS